MLGFAALTPTYSARHSGFSIVEVLIGLAIGMISLLMIVRIVLGSEGDRRTTTGSADAQNNGALALYLLQRDIRQAGYGISSTRLLACSLTLRSGVSLAALAPVIVNPAGVPAGDANTDTVLIVFGSAAGSPEGTSVIQQPAQTQYTVTTPTVFRVNDRVVAALPTRPASCSLSLDSVTAATSSPPVVTVATGLAAMSSGTVFNLGASPVVRAYAVRGATLTSCDLMLSDCLNAANVADRSIWVPIADDIVSLRAQYGRDTSTPMDAIVDAYDQASPTTACGWARTLAARFALVARSPQREKTQVTGTAPAWVGSTAAAINLSAAADWQHYRYQVFQTTTPARNMSWLGVQPGC
ncbi:PilW family protein [Hydrocarboniphaga sp.]|uniref:PilW family protein n=1 Tax=Hydrocarboniphaga sp. TaxID=2033016 RepID=UPI002628A6B9|nr:PilW family protein [Hydrocarboniphaga sp.]